MPTFTTDKGSEVYVPFHGMLMCEASVDGLLMTRIWVAQTINGAPVVFDVKGSLETVKLAFLTEHLRVEHGIIPPTSLEQ